MHSTPKLPPLEQTAARDRLLEAALKLFTARGYAATTVREIVLTARVTKPLLYYYFQSKEGIYLALMEETYTIFEAQVEEIIAVPGTARQQTKRFVTGLFDAFLEHITRVRLLYAVYFGPPQGTPFFNLDEYYNRIIETIEKILLSGIARGELIPVNSADVSWVIAGSLNCAMEEQLCQLNPRIDRERLVRMIDLIFSGIALGENR